MTRKALGKGLKALLPEQAGRLRTGVTTIPVDSISPNPNQPRKRFDEDSLQELVSSIRSQGLLQPVLVKPSATGYELIAGERRWRASRLAGLTEVPALVKEAGAEQSLVMALVENVQRENLNPIEAAQAYQSLGEGFGLSQEEVARLVGKDRASVANYVRLLKLPLSIQEDLSLDRLSMGHARALLSLPSRSRQLEARNAVVEKGLSVRETEALAKRMLRPAFGRKPPRARDPHLSAVESDLRRRFGTKVTVSPASRGGAIHIHYHSEGELDRLIELLLGDGSN